MKPQKTSFTRRDFLKILGVSAGTGLLVGAGFLRHSFVASKQALQVLQRSKFLLGTPITITAHHSNLHAAQIAFNKAFAAITNVDHIMSVHRAESQVSQINRLAGSAMVNVDPQLIDILSTAASVHQANGGIYDISCLPLMQLYGFYQHQTEKTFPSDRRILDTISLVNQRYVEIDAVKQRVGLLRAGMGIDLGSIGKGYAVDQAVKALQAEGIQNALVDAGGNLYALGAPFGNEDPQAAWQVAIRNPYAKNENAYFETLHLRNQAVATSGNYENYQCFAQQEVGHILNALSGKASDGAVSATVVAATATFADALSTTAFLLGPDKARQLNNSNTKVYFHGYDEVQRPSKC